MADALSRNKISVKIFFHPEQCIGCYHKWKLPTQLREQERRHVQVLVSP